MHCFIKELFLSLSHCLPLFVIFRQQQWQRSWWLRQRWTKKSRPWNSWCRWENRISDWWKLIVLFIYDSSFICSHNRYVLFCASSPFSMSCVSHLSHFFTLFSQFTYDSSVMLAHTCWIGLPLSTFISDCMYHLKRSLFGLFNHFTVHMISLLYMLQICSIKDLDCSASKVQWLGAAYLIFNSCHTTSFISFWWYLAFL